MTVSRSLWAVQETMRTGYYEQARLSRGQCTCTKTRIIFAANKKINTDFHQHKEELTVMPRVYEYNDYRKFLGDYYSETKRTKCFFSYRYFSTRAGVKSPVFLKLVIEGKRNLTDAMVKKFSKALNFNDQESVYFKYLVLCNQAKTDEEKQKYAGALKSISALAHACVIDPDSSNVFDAWYTHIIHDLVSFYDFKDDCHEIAAALEPGITPEQVKESLEILLKEMLLQKNPDGSYHPSSNEYMIREVENSAVLRNYYRQLLQLADKSLDSIPEKEKSIRSFCFSVKEETYSEILTEIDRFWSRIVQIVTEAQNNENRIYHMNIQLFPVTKKIKRKKSN